MKPTQFLLLCFSAPFQAALNMLITCSALELQKDNILSVLLHPGWVRTKMGGDEVSYLESNSHLLIRWAVSSKGWLGFMHYPHVSSVIFNVGTRKDKDKYMGNPWENYWQFFFL